MDTPPRKSYPVTARARTLLLCGGVALGLVVAGLLAARSWRTTPGALPSDDDEDPRLSFATPYLNVRPEVKYVGDETCASCHPKLAASFHQHPMGRSFSLVSAAATLQHRDRPGGNTFEQFGFQFLVEQQDKTVLHKQVKQNSQGQPVAEAAAEVEFVLGSGSHGFGCLVNHDGYLFQSPISWYSQKGKWDISPGYNAELSFGRPIKPECLFCHCNYADAVEHTINRYRAPIFRGLAIGCERCHGPGELHVQARERGEALPRPDHTIVNPRHLEPTLREAVCQQCHLLGFERVLGRRRGVFDYRPGLPLHLFWTVFTEAAGSDGHSTAVSQVEQVQASACFQKSGGKLGCISCHNPHSLPAPEKKVAFYRQRCLNCHQEKGCSLDLEVRLRQQKDDSCFACHMPRASSSDIAHTALSDHRILRSPDDPAPLSAAHQQPVAPDVSLIYFHRDQPPVRPAELNRDVGLALMQHARPEPMPEAERLQLGRLALRYLEPATRRDPEDVAAQEAKTKALWYLGRVPEAISTSEAILAKIPGRERALIDLAFLSEAAGDLPAAVRYWRRAIEVDPWAPTHRLHLARLLVLRRQWQEALPASEQAVRLNPCAPEANQWLIVSLLRNGTPERAYAALEALVALQPDAEAEMRRWFEKQVREGP
jgi:hypothetical protein